ncbi:hypothetical protein [Paraburkholderia lycopersici]|uniref:HupE / UreJ protein n=1 Tax=Paraburkholderia lycopersici TaxID=416944 RepID=A0A1G6V7A5_9BURK|nr:hypothetical protein [Paraburkholderia lycopersici]SDD49559.1 hypothetical protein SAMN05421548_12072 [Paraburkholderia lycopersici]
MEAFFGAHWGAWAAVVGSGVFHGVNPAMGWLFATALGLQRGSRAALLLALPPIALGHAASILLFTTSTAVLGARLPGTALHWGLGALLIGWAVWQHAYGHRHRARVGMTAGFAGLAAWSALMATMHGAGLMLMPAMLPLCGGAAGIATSELALAVAFTLLHMLATLATTAAIALLAYEYFGLGVLRRGWINFDWLWRGALVATGTLMIATA